MRVVARQLENMQVKFRNHGSSESACRLHQVMWPREGGLTHAKSFGFYEVDCARKSTHSAVIQTRLTKHVLAGRPVKGRGLIRGHSLTTWAEVKG